MTVNPLPDAVGTETSATQVIDWNELHRLYGSRLRRRIARNVPAPWVDDVLQETFFRAYRSRDRVDLSLPLWPWLATLASRSCADHWRWNREIPVADPLMAEGDGRPGPEEALETAELRGIVAGVLEGMPRRHSQLLRLAVMESVPASRVDSVASSDATRAALTRARRGFRRRYLAHTEGGSSLVGVVLAGGAVGRLRSAARRITSAARDSLPSAALAGAAAGVMTVLTLGVQPPQIGARAAVGASVGAAAPIQGVATVLSEPMPVVPSDTRGREPVDSGTTRTHEGGQPRAKVPAAIASDIHLGSAEAEAQLRLDWVDPTGSGYTDVTVGVRCEQSQVARQACRALGGPPSAVPAG